MDYKFLTPEQRRQIIEEQLAQFEAEHFGHELNKLRAENNPVLSEQDRAQVVEASTQAMETIEAAIDETAKARDALDTG